MKTLILAGGYGSRLKTLIDCPKALLEVGGKSILSYILKNVCRAEDVETIIISTNEHFCSHFESYLAGTTWRKPVQLVVEPSNTEENKIGSIGGIQFVTREIGLSDDLLIIGGDNLFGMDLSAFLKSAKGRSVIGAYNVRDKKMATEYGVVTTDTNGRITDFKEKPEHPNSTLVSTAIYHFPKKILLRISEYLNEGGARDRLGDFISWLHKRENVYVHEFSNYWFDVGCMDSLQAAKRHFARKPSSGDP